MTALPPGSTVGIMGGGQLGRMLAMAAAQLGYRVHIYAPERDSAAAAVADVHWPHAWDDMASLTAFSQACDVVTFEWENVPVAAAHSVEAGGVLRPGADSLDVAQDRLVEKAFAAKLGLTVPRHAEVTDAASLAAAIAHVSTPAILKTAREGYDGKGQARIDGPADASAAWAAIGQQRAVLEERIDFMGEFSVIVVRGQDGGVRHWDAPHNVHNGGILATSRLPAPADWAGQIAQATQQAEALATALGHVGVLACEFFATADGPIFNEMAPRVHNSGHWTIEGAVTSQFENHIRAICGLPLGDTATIARPVVMHNLIGGDIDRVPGLLGQTGAHVHHYGKADVRAGRKLGHVSWVGMEPA
jgi:5-(carboxyamino)imidazole ribonucleotide synthase